MFAYELNSHGHETIILCMIQISNGMNIQVYQASVVSG